MRFISDSDTEHVTNIQAVNDEVLDFVVKTGTRNLLFAQIGKKVVALEINEIYQYESDVPVTTSDYRDNAFINDHFPTAGNSFVGLMEDGDKLFVVTNQYIVDIDNDNLRYEAPGDGGNIIAFQTIKDGNEMKYLVVCEKCAITLNSSLTQVWKTDVETGKSFIGGYCGSNFMLLFTKGSMGNHIVSYSFPLNIAETGVVEIPSGNRISGICEDDISLFFVLDTNLFCAAKNNILRCVKEYDSVFSFEVVDVMSQSQTYPAVMTRTNNQIDVEIITDVSVETDEEGDPIYNLSSESLSVKQDGVGLNDMLFANNTVYSLTDSGVFETPIAQYNDSFTTLDQESYLSGKAIAGGAVFSTPNSRKGGTTKLFVDKNGGVYGRYEVPSAQLAVNVKDI